MNKLIEDQKHQFNVVIGKSEAENVFNRLFDWHIQSITQFIDTEIERLKEKQKVWRFQNFKDRGSLEAFVVEQINHLESIKKELV